MNQKLQITKILGTSYLCSDFTNSDGTVVTDHPIMLFDTNKDIYAAIMFTSSGNEFTTQHPSGQPIGFYGCSNHKGEKVSLRVLQSEVYLIPKCDDVKLSEYKFKYIRFNKHLLSTLKFCLEYGIKTNFEHGIKHVHFYNDTPDVNKKEDIMNEMIRFIEKTLDDDNFYYPERGPVNVKYQRKTKMKNEKAKKAFNSFIFKKRYGN